MSQMGKESGRNEYIICLTPRELLCCLNRHGGPGPHRSNIWWSKKIISLAREQLEEIVLTFQSVLEISLAPNQVHFFSCFDGGSDVWCGMGRGNSLGIHSWQYQNPCCSSPDTTWWRSVYSDGIQLMISKQDQLAVHYGWLLLRKLSTPWQG